MFVREGEWREGEKDQRSSLVRQCLPNVCFCCLVILQFCYMLETTSREVPQSHYSGEMWHPLVCIETKARGRSAFIYTSKFYCDERKCFVNGKL